ncbi:MAG: hypothetical protein KGS61_15060 [Verrucomicrobia bacterium]|nr:hypothetical protein [Verrucomicrobiota bacterium]
MTVTVTGLFVFSLAEATPGAASGRPRSRDSLARILRWRDHFASSAIPAFL